MFRVLHFSQAVLFCVCRHVAVSWHCTASGASRLGLLRPRGGAPQNCWRRSPGAGYLLVKPFRVQRPVVRVCGASVRHALPAQPALMKVHLYLRRESPQGRRVTGRSLVTVSVVLWWVQELVFLSEPVPLTQVEEGGQWHSVAKGFFM